MLITLFLFLFNSSIEHTFSFVYKYQSNDAIKKDNAMPLNTHLYEPYSVSDNDAAKDTELKPNKTSITGVKQHKPPINAERGTNLFIKSFRFLSFDHIFTLPHFSSKKIINFLLLRYFLFYIPFQQ